MQMLKKTKYGMLSPFGNSSKHKKKYSDTEVTNMKKLKALGKTYAEIGKLFNVSRSAIYRAIQRHNPIIDNTNIPLDYVPISEYMEEYNETYTTVYWHVRNNNLDSIKVNNKIYVPIEAKIKRKTISEEKIDKIIHLCNTTSWSLRAIGKEVGCSYQTVKAYRDLLC